MRQTLTLYFAFCLLVACGDNDTTELDATPDVATDAGCTSDSDCSDNIFCNGQEICASGQCLSGNSDVCPARFTCNEDTESCESDCSQEDVDGDGALAIECGGTDCDDTNPARFPGNPEVCDVMNLDEDCDPTTFGFRDADGDLTADASCCNMAADGSLNCGTDCDDQRPGTNPDVPEVCDRRDNDCDGSIDEGVQVMLYVDSDEDGFGHETGVPRLGCIDENGGRFSDGKLYVTDAMDCDDSQILINPGASEVCALQGEAPVDENCNGLVDEAEVGNCNCDLGDTQQCMECAGAIRTCIEELQGNVWGPCSITPNQFPEVCSPSTVSTDQASDEDCDGLFDENLTVECYQDSDGDGFAMLGAPKQVLCGTGGACPAGTTFREPTEIAESDCNDSDVTFQRIECFTDNDKDGWGTGAVVSVSCIGCNRTDQTEESGDCCDTDDRVHPMSAVSSALPGACGGYDYNCNGFEERTFPRQSQMCSPQEPPSCASQSTANAQWVGSVPRCGVTAAIGPGCSLQTIPGTNVRICEQNMPPQTPTRTQTCR